MQQELSKGVLLTAWEALLSDSACLEPSWAENSDGADVDLGKDIGAPPGDYIFGCVIFEMDSKGFLWSKKPNAE